MPPLPNSPIPCYLALSRPAQASCFANASRKLRKQTSSMRKTVHTEVLISYVWISHRNVNAASTVKLGSSSFVTTALRHYLKMAHPQRNFRHTLNTGYFDMTDLQSHSLKPNFVITPCVQQQGRNFVNKLADFAVRYTQTKLLEFRLPAMRTRHSFARLGV